MTDYDILASSLVLLGCLAKRKRMINRRVRKRLDVKQFRHFGRVFVKEDRETGNWCRSRVCLHDKVAGATRQAQRRQRVCRAIVARSCDTSRMCDIGFILLRTVITVSVVAEGPARRTAAYWVECH